METKSSYSCRCVSWLLFHRMYIFQCVSAHNLPDRAIKHKQTLHIYVLFFLKKKGKEGMRKGVGGFYCYYLFKGHWVIKGGKNKLQGIVQKGSGGRANIIVTQPIHPHLTLLSHHIVKITDWHASCFWTVGRYGGLWGKYCFCLEYHKIPIKHSSSI